MADTARCRSCKAPIIWTTTTKSDKRMPVDAEPVKGGNVTLVTGNDGPRSMVLTAAEAERRADELLYTSHFSTCPESKDWRR